MKLLHTIVAVFFIILLPTHVKAVPTYSMNIAPLHSKVFKTTLSASLPILSLTDRQPIYSWQAENLNSQYFLPKATNTKKNRTLVQNQIKKPN
ncbi:hypothetical protein [Spartinivicinus ruber]|uniref:hypothetical protein n=1 Tax=Spartinivicinus ruber TaxID=2683272 RepID=UPI0013D0112F|nr:hypothetical protein [Spartinivicinus ruber]